MSTNALIGLKISDNEFKAIYCHWDGYPDYTGTILNSRYRTKSKVEKLLALGDISSLGEFIDHTKTGDDSFTTIAYHRDRGEELQRASHYLFNKTSYKPKSETDMHYLGIEYLYIFDPNLNKWSTYSVSAEEKISLLKHDYKASEKELKKHNMITLNGRR